LLKVINDYKRYGADPSKIQKWVIKTKKSTPLLIKQDKTDKNKITLSDHIPTPVDSCHKINLSFECGLVQISIPRDVTKKEAKIIKDILDSLAA